MVSAFDRYAYLLTAHRSLYDDVHFSESLSQAVTKQLGLSNFCAICQVDANKIDQSLEVI